MTPEAARRRFAAVVVPHLDDAYSLARWLTSNGADAEDVVQEASLRAFRAIETFGDRNPRAWVLTIVRNCAYSWLAKNRPKAIVQGEDLEEAERTAVAKSGAPPVADAEAEMIARQDGAALEKAVAALPVAFREVLVLREVQGLAYRDIADVMRLPIGTVMSRLARARDLLMKAMRENGT